jgi:hypothetical protein
MLRAEVLPRCTTSGLRAVQCHPMLTVGRVRSGAVPAGLLGTSGGAAYLMEPWAGVRIARCARTSARRW